jgi:c-di-GMP-binding flagellar brake protein YcgR
MGTRKFSRIRFAVDATVRTSNGRQFQGELQNLSMSGMFIVTEERLPLDEEVEIAMLLTGTSPQVSINFNGKVCRISDDGLGFAFEKIDLDSYTHLRNIIAYNIEDSEKVMEEIYNSIDEKLAAAK